MAEASLRLIQWAPVYTRNNITFHQDRFGPCVRAPAMSAFDRRRVLSRCTSQERLGQRVFPTGRQAAEAGSPTSTVRLRCSMLGSNCQASSASPTGRKMWTDDDVSGVHRGPLDA